MARPDFRAAAARRLSEERELSPAIISLLSSDNAGRTVGVRTIPVDRIESNPQQPRLIFDVDALDELSASIREHGVLQPILVRPLGNNRYQLIAGERRWRASKEAGLATIPALVEELDDDTALEISIIENLQREDLSPLDEASMYDRMVREHGYSIRKLAEKLGKDKGYLENRLRLADAPEEIRELVSVRKDTLSHAYELHEGHRREEAAPARPPRSPAASSPSSSSARRSTGARPGGDLSRTSEKRSKRFRSRATATATHPTSGTKLRPSAGWTGRATGTHDLEPDRRLARRRHATTWPTRSRSSSASSGHPTWSDRSRNWTGPTSRST